MDYEAGLDGPKANYYKLTLPAESTITSMAFSPTRRRQTLMIAGSWDKIVRCIQVENGEKPELLTMTKIKGPVLDLCWNNDGRKAFIGSCENEVLCWDLGKNETSTIGLHGGPVRVCHWMNAPKFSCLMTGSWDRTLKFWDMRSPLPIMVIGLPERISFAAVDYPMAIVGTAQRGLILYHLGGRPQEYKQAKPSSKYRYRCAAIFRDENCVPAGFALGSVEGRVTIQYASPFSMKEKYVFKCRRYDSNGKVQSIKPVNDMAFHPLHGTLATVGSDGIFSYWDVNAKKRLLQSETMEQSISKCAFSETGETFAYSVSYDWAKGADVSCMKKLNHIYFRSCFNELKPKE